MEFVSHVQHTGYRRGPGRSGPEVAGHRRAGSQLRRSLHFYSSDYCYSYGGQFWNGVSKFKNMLIEKLKPSGKTISVVWNNLIKIGKARVGKEEAKGQPNEAILKWEDNWFGVV